jgi:DNA end-binding protein Ku
VIREAIRKEGMVALGKVVFTSREHIIALEPRNKGMVGVTLRFPYEVRQPEEYFDIIDDEKVPKDMLDLAIHIVDTKRGKFEPKNFEDHYENALKELLRKKQKGEKIERPREAAPTNVVNLMEALRQSVKAENSHVQQALHRKRVRSGLRDSARCCCRSPARRIKRLRPNLPRARVAARERQAENRGLPLGQCSLDHEVARDFGCHSQ